MLPVEIGVRLFLGVILLLMNGFYVTTEFALTRVRQFDKEEFEGNRGLERAWKMTDELELYLSSCQVGITISSVALGIVAEPAMSAAIGQVFVGIGVSETVHSTIAILVAVAIINIFHVVIGEQVPTYLGVERSQLVSKYLAPVLHLWMRLMYPVVIFSDKISKLILRVFGIEITRSWAEEETGPSNLTELRREMGVLMSGLPITEERQEEILKSIDISTIPVSDIMISRENISSLSTSDSTEEVLEFVQSNPHTRYPLYDPEKDQILGLIYSAEILQNIQDLQDDTMNLSDISQTIPVVHPSTPVSEVIDHFQESKQELAIISKETTQAPVPWEEAIGLVTSTDALEEITGDLEDPLSKID